MVTNLEFKQGLKASLPIGAISFLDGCIFGFVARSYELTSGEATSMSVLITSGAAQFLLLPYWNQTSIGVLILLTALISVRYLFLGAGVGVYFRGKPAMQTYPFLFFLFDENWALTLHQTRNNHFSLPYFLGAGLSLYVAWVSGTLAGSLFPYRDLSSHESLNLLIYLIFAAILVGQWNGKRSIALWSITAVVAVAVNEFVAAEWSLVAGTAAGLLTMLILRPFQDQKS
jgi:branched chain amino acid efflux pump